jgi:exosortase/archaeosortase family protein
MAALATYLSAHLLSLGGIPVTWHGTEFVLVSRAGGVVTGTVTPGCSSVFSVATFLGLLGLMYIDLKRGASATLKLAVAGVASLILLNSARIGLLIWVGYLDGAASLWSLHYWVGYAIFLGFYLVVLLVYNRVPGPRVRAQSIPQPLLARRAQASQAPGRTSGRSDLAAEVADGCL